VQLLFLIRKLLLVKIYLPYLTAVLHKLDEPTYVRSETARHPDKRTHIFRHSGRYAYHGAVKYI